MNVPSLCCLYYDGSIHILHDKDESKRRPRGLFMNIQESTIGFRFMVLMRNLVFRESNRAARCVCYLHRDHAELVIVENM